MAKDFIKWMDNLPLWLQLVFCIPVLDIVWAVYRIVKGVVKENAVMLIVGILWIVPGAVFCWICDLITTLVWEKRLLAE